MFLMKHTNQLVTGAEIFGEWNDATHEWNSAEAKVSGLQCQSTAVSNGRHTRTRTRTRTHAHARARVCARV